MKLYEPISVRQGALPKVQAVDCSPVASENRAYCADRQSEAYEVPVLQKN
jgi:hypothetical protein